MFLIEEALADAGAAPAGGSFLSTLPIIVVLILMMYFMIIRPQSKKAKEHQNLLSKIQVGDEVATIGGLLGVVTQMGEQFIVLRVAEQATITIQKASIAQVLPKGTLKNIN